MGEHLGFLVLGLGSGALIAGLGIGLAMNYRASGIINIAQGAMAMFVATVFFNFRENGEVVFPVVGIPDRVFVICRPTVATALGVTAVYALVLGAAAYLLLFRPMRHAPPLAQLVGSVGLFLYLWSVTKLKFPTDPLLRLVLPHSNTKVFGRLIPADRYWLALIVVLASACVWVLYRFTNFGLATAAIADNERGAILLGLRPVRIAALTWSMATLISGFAVIFAAQIVQLDPLIISMLVVPALAAAMAGQFTSIPTVTASGIAIGMIQSWVTSVQPDLDWLPNVGWSTAVPVLIILGLMVVRGDTVLGRGSAVTARLPVSPEPRRVLMWAALLGGGAIAFASLGSSDMRRAAIGSSGGIILSLSVVVLTGYVGQVSLAPLAFSGVSGFLVAKFAGAGLPFPVAPVLAALAATGVGIAVGIPALRVRGMSLAVATLAGAVAIEELMFKSSWLTGGSGGVATPDASLFGIDLSISRTKADFPRPAFAVMAVVLALACAVGVSLLRRHRIGLEWLAVRGNERAAAAVGIDVGRAKLSAFAISAFLAGIAGSLFAYQRTLSVSSFQVMGSLSVVALAYLAGISSVSGALLAGLLTPGGIMVWLGDQQASDVTMQFAMNGLALMALAVFVPEGIVGRAGSMAARLRSKHSSSPSGPDELVPAGP